MPTFDEEGNLVSLDDDDTLDLNDDDVTDTDDTVDDDSFKHKYDVLQGKYNAETSRQDAMIRQVLAEKAAAELELESLRTTSIKKETFVPSEQDRFEDEITKLESEFPSLAGGIKALVSKTVKQEIKPTEDRIDNAANLSAKTAYEGFLGKLDGAMESWRQINVDPEFTAWLSEPDRYTGVAKMELLKGAYSNMNVGSTLAFFEDFIATKGSGSTNTDIEDTTTTTPTTRKSPAPTNAGGNLNPDTTPATITRADIANFYKLRALDRWNGSEEEAQKYEARILKAVREKKVR